ATELVLPRVQYRRQCDNGGSGDADSGYVPAQSRRGQGSSSIGLHSACPCVVRSGLWERGSVGECRSAAPGAKALAPRARLLQNIGRVKGWEQGDNESPPKQNETNT